MSKLEQMLEFAPSVQKNISTSIDTYAGKTAVLYTGQISSGGFGLQNAQPFQYGYDLGGGYQVHMHGPDRNSLTYGSVERNGSFVKGYNGYESAMMDPILNNNFNKFYR